MNFQNSLFFMPIMVGLIFILVGFIMYKFPPKKINYLYGYRTSNSMKTQESWDFAQKYASILMVYGGFGLTFISVLGLFFKVSTEIGVFISTLFIILTVLILIVKTEKAIKQHLKNEN